MSLSDLLESEIFFGAFLFGIAIVFIALFGVVFYKKWAENKKNEGKPIETKAVKVVTKRNIMNNNPNVGSFVLFEFDDGSRQELSINANTSSTIAENDTGMLTYQGTKFIKFERNINN